jgi:hypothetical protein
MKLRLAAASLLFAASLTSAAPPPEPQGAVVPGPDKSPEAAIKPFLNNVQKLAMSIRIGPAEDTSHELLLLSAAPLNRMAPPKGHTWVQIDKPLARNLLHYLEQTGFFLHGRDASKPAPLVEGYRIHVKAGPDGFYRDYTDAESLIALSGLRAVLAGAGKALPDRWQKNEDGSLLCPGCKGKMNIMSIGKCSSCGEMTASGSHKLCRVCSAKHGKCMSCAKELPKAGSNQAADALKALMAPLAQEQKKLDARADALIEKLGDDNFRVRKQASDALAKLGYAVRDRLVQALEGGNVDLETRTRIEQILRELPETSFDSKKEVTTPEGNTIRIRNGMIEAVNAEGKILWRTRPTIEVATLKLEKGKLHATTEDKTASLILDPATGQTVGMIQRSLNANKLQIRL